MGQQTPARLPLQWRAPPEPEKAPLSTGSVQGPIVPPDQKREHILR